MRLSGLWIYPVKGMRGIALPSAAVEPCGLADDRRWMVVDARNRFLSQRQLPAMARFGAAPDGSGGLRLSFETERVAVPRPGPDAERIEVSVWGDRLLAAAAGSGIDAWLSRQLRQGCRLVFLDDPAARRVGDGRPGAGGPVSFADAYPVLLTVCGSLAALNAALPHPVGMDRFRPNLVVEGAAAWQEADWQRLQVGALRFEAPANCTRCLVTTIDQATGEIHQPGEPLRTLARLRPGSEGVVFGRNLLPLDRGWVRLGDPVEVLQPGSPAGR